MNDYEMIMRFEKLCSQIFFHRGRFQFSFDAIIHSPDFEEIINSEDYPFLVEKMKNLLVLINGDKKLIELEVEELWKVI